MNKNLTAILSCNAGSDIGVIIDTLWAKLKNIQHDKTT